MPDRTRLSRLTVLAAGLATALAGAPAGAAQPPKAGVSAAVQGEVSRRSTLEQQAPDAPNRLQAGTAVFMQDLVQSGAESRAQILLRDQSTFKLGPESEIVIDEFVYDPASGSGEMLARAAEGAFRFVTGQIGKADSDDVKVETPVATIGVRGTRFIADLGRTTEGGTPEGLFVLTGPGIQNNTADRRGAITVSAGGKTVTVRRSGWGTTVAEGGQPTEPRPIPAEVMAQLDSQLSGAAPPGGDLGDTAGGGTIAGQGAAETAGQTSQETQQTGQEIQQVENQQTQLADVASGEELGDGETMTSPSGIFNNLGQPISTWDLVNDVTSGIATAAETEVPIVRLSDTDLASRFGADSQINVLDTAGLETFGSYNVTFYADFSAKEFGAQFSDIDLSAEQLTNAVIQEVNNFPGNGPAFITFSASQDTGSDSPVTASPGCQQAGCSGAVDILALDGEAVGGIAHSLQIGEFVGSGSVRAVQSDEIPIQPTSE